MNARYQTLNVRIKMELKGLEQILTSIQRHWDAAHTALVDQDAYLNSVALNLHGFYSGIERIFHLIATELDGGIVGGDSWHAELLKQMTLEIPHLRPAVMKSETAAKLSEYRRFRHLIRHIYATDLDVERIRPLVVGLPCLRRELWNELSVFLQFLDKLVHSEPG
jgi:hypothetical protein